MPAPCKYERVNRKGNKVIMKQLCTVIIEVIPKHSWLI